MSLERWTMKRTALLGLVATVVAVVAISGRSIAQEYAQASVRAAAKPHPLDSMIRYSSAHADYIRQNVHDYSYRLVKRERLNGKLQAYQFADVLVRCERENEDGSFQPLSVFMQFLAPKEVVDRRVLYVADKNDGKVLVRKGGVLMKHLKLKVDPNSERAKSESKNSITDIGFDKLIMGLVDQAKLEIELDPTAENTQVTHFQNAVVNKRSCTHVRIVHPEQRGEMEYHMVSLYIDDQLHVPARLVTYGWPEKEGEKPPVQEEYTYLNLKLNVGFTDSDFAESLLEEPELSIASQDKTVTRN